VLGERGVFRRSIRLVSAKRPPVNVEVVEHPGGMPEADLQGMRGVFSLSRGNWDSHP